jgi:hypothetical protein
MTSAFGRKAEPGLVEPLKVAFDPLRNGTTVKLWHESQTYLHLTDRRFDLVRRLPQRELSDISKLISYSVYPGPPGF